MNPVNRALCFTLFSICSVFSAATLAQNVIFLKCDMVGTKDFNLGEKSTTSIIVDSANKSLTDDGEKYSFTPRVNSTATDDGTPLRLEDVIFTWNDAVVSWGRKVYVAGVLDDRNPYFYSLDRITGQLTTLWSKGACKKVDESERLF